MKNLLVLVLLAGSTASAAVVFQDSFNYATGTYGAGSSLGPWTVGNIDVVGPSFFGLLCTGGSGSCVDTDGSSNRGGTLTRSLMLNPGDYALQFRLGGSQRGETNTVRVEFAGWWQDYTLESSAPHSIYSSPAIHIASAQPAAITFTHLTAGDNRGLVLDDVALLSDVPEPGAAALSLAGIALILAMRRRS